MSSKSKQHDFLSNETCISIEAAASLAAKGKIVQNDKWKNDIDINVVYERLLAKVSEIRQAHDNLRVTKDMLHAWVKTRFPKNEHQGLLSVIDDGVFTLKSSGGYVLSFNSVSVEDINKRLLDMAHNPIELTDDVSNAANKLYSKITGVREHWYIFDPFKISPFFIPLEGIVHVNSATHFEPVVVNGVTGFRMLQISGIKAWFCYEGIHDLYFNPNPAEPEAATMEAPETYTPEATQNNHDLSKAGLTISNKLRAALAVVKALQGDDKKFMANKATKERIRKWLESRYKEYGLTLPDGKMSKKAITEVVNVANWNTSGGATPTNQRNNI